MVKRLYTYPEEQARTRERTEICYIGVDTRKFTLRPELREKLRKEWGVAENTPVILYSARLVDQKNPKLMLRVLDHLNTQLVNPLISSPSFFDINIHISSINSLPFLFPDINNHY